MSIEKCIRDPRRQISRDQLYPQFTKQINGLSIQYSDVVEKQEMINYLFVAFHELYEGYDPYRGVPLVPYLGYMLCRKAYNFARKEVSTKRRLVQLRVCANEQPFLFDPWDEVNERLHRDNLMIDLPRLVRQLPPQQRNVINAMYYADQPANYTEAAEMLEIMTATVRSNHRHALRALREKLTARDLI